MQNMPSRFLRDIDVPCQLVRRDTFLMGRYEVHGREPFHQGNLGVLEDCTDKDREVVQAVRAAESAVRACIAVMVSAIRTSNIVAPSLFFQELLAGCINP